jgi:hypothetical protein
MYEVKEPVWQFIDHWQTLITGALALIAGFGTVWATIRSARREIDAAREQTEAAQHQTAVTRDIERRRIAREEYAFHAMLDAVMEAIIEDVEDVRTISTEEPRSSLPAFQATKQVKQVGFEELRGAFLRFGGPLTGRFLRLNKDIEDYMAQVREAEGDLGDVFRPETGLFNRLDRIEEQAIKLRGEAAQGMKRCLDELADDVV